MVKITPLLRDLLPTAIYDKVSHLFGADTSMADWKGHEGASEPKAAPKPQPESGDQPEAER